MTPTVISTMFICLAVVVVVGAWAFVRHLSNSKQTTAALASSKEYQGLSEEYRRLSDMAITAQEHTELKLTDLSVQLSQLRDKLDQMQRILNEVE